MQLQLKQAIRLGSPPSLMCVKRTEDAGTMSEDDGLPCSPPEYVSPHKALVRHLHTRQGCISQAHVPIDTLTSFLSSNQAQRNSFISLEGTDSDEDQVPAHTPLVTWLQLIKGAQGSC